MTFLFQRIRLLFSFLISQHCSLFAHDLIPFIFREFYIILNRFVSTCMAPPLPLSYLDEWFAMENQETQKERKFNVVIRIGETEIQRDSNHGSRAFILCNGANHRWIGFCSSFRLSSVSMWNAFRVVQCNCDIITLRTVYFV